MKIHSLLPIGCEWWRYELMERIRSKFMAYLCPCQSKWKAYCTISRWRAQEGTKYFSIYTIYFLLSLSGDFQFDTTYILINQKILKHIPFLSSKDLDDLIEAALLYYSGKKILDSKPIPLRLEKDNDPRLLMSPLKFPGKLAVDVRNNRLFISDSNHNRIVGSLSLSFSLWLPKILDEYFLSQSFMPGIMVFFNFWASGSNWPWWELLNPSGKLWGRRSPWW